MRSRADSILDRGGSGVVITKLTGNALKWRHKRGSCYKVKQMVFSVKMEAWAWVLTENVVTKYGTKAT